MPAESAPLARVDPVEARVVPELTAAQIRGLIAWHRTCAAALEVELARRRPPVVTFVRTRRGVVSPLPFEVRQCEAHEPEPPTKPLGEVEF